MLNRYTTDEILANLQLAEAKMAYTFVALSEIPHVKWKSRKYTNTFVSKYIFLHIDVFFKRHLARHTDFTMDDFVMDS